MEIRVDLTAHFLVSLLLQMLRQLRLIRTALRRRYSELGEPLKVYRVHLEGTNCRYYNYEPRSDLNPGSSPLMLCVRHLAQFEKFILRQEYLRNVICDELQRHYGRNWLGNLTRTGPGHTAPSYLNANQFIWENAVMLLEQLSINHANPRKHP